MFAEAQLTTRINQNDEEIETLIKQRSEIIEQKKTIEDDKDEEINNYKKHIDTLQTEFGTMLSETLTKIKAKIEQANKQWEEENDAKILSGLEQIAMRGAPGQN